jgi:hypothetical protein
MNLEQIVCDTEAPNSFRRVPKQPPKGVFRARTLALLA